MNVQISGLSSLTFETSFDCYKIPCVRCGSKKTHNKMSGDLPPYIQPGYYCDRCNKVVCKKASVYYKKQMEESAKDLKSTVLFRKNGIWSNDEIDKLTREFKEGVWSSSKHPKCLIITCHLDIEPISKALGGFKDFKVTKLIGIKSKRLPFLPF